MKRLLWVLGLLSALSAGSARAQWKMQDSHVTSDLRGIDSVGGGVAWASGSHGTVLRTGDMGKTWQVCAPPPDATDLDFRGVQAFDAKTAIVMSSGPGDKSRLYKTADGCQTWTLLFTNPDKEGFWDSVSADLSSTPGSILLLGDPVAGHFQIRYSKDGGRTWRLERSVPSYPGEGAFAASNSSMLPDLVDTTCQVPQFFVTGGPQGGRVFITNYKGKSCRPLYNAGPTSVFAFSAKGPGAGFFSIADAPGCIVFVGGDYQRPDSRSGTAGYQCPPRGYEEANTLPGGYRSAVQFDLGAKYGIAVGPNGTDVSTDSGRNWRALKPVQGEAPDADRNWNALSLPFVVGPKGRIGILRDGAVGAPGGSAATK